MTWWRDAVVYQIYPRSFADGNGDGTGDLVGIRSRLDHLADLGIDALWLSPFYPSPLADGGYDVSDYCDVDPLFGTLDDFDALVEAAASRGIRVIVDIVPNHCSDQHPLFQAALAAEPGSPERDLFIFREGKGDAGEQPPNNWHSAFGGPAWTRVPDGEWYLHLFDTAQPDWNWLHPEVPALFEKVIRFWLDRGVAGLRVDVASAMYKDPALPDLEGDGTRVLGMPAPYAHRPEVHDLFRTWRAILDSYPADVFPGKRTAVGEVWAFPEYIKPYYEPGGLPQIFNFNLMLLPWEASWFRAAIGTSLDLADGSEVVAPWVLNSHDITRSVSRFGWADNAVFRQPTVGDEIDVALGTRRARAAALMILALPGSAYIYEGEELGLPQFVEIPDDRRDDPQWSKSNGTKPSRDGSRIPIPWSGDAPPYGFSPEGVDTWLPQPANWAGYTVEAQQAEPDSTLHMYRAAIRLRQRGDGDMAWVEGDAAGHVIHFRRGDGFACVVNMGDSAVPLPPHEQVILASGPLDGTELPPDTAVWLQN